MNTDLALLGGGKVIVDPFVRHNPIGSEELEAAGADLGPPVSDGTFFELSLTRRLRTSLLAPRRSYSSDSS